MNTKMETPAIASRKVIDRVLAHPFFSGLSAAERALVATAVVPGAASEAVFQQGETIFREGEPANRFYLIESGSVMLEVHEPADGTFQVQKLESGEALGFSWLFPSFAWCLRARALTPATVIVLDGAHLLVTAEQNKAFGYDLMKRVGRLAIKRLQAARKEFVKVSKQLQVAGPGQEPAGQNSQSK